jgi:site-specific recombinase XerD
LTSLARLAASWKRSLRARNLAEATQRNYAEGVRQFLAYLTVQAPEITEPADIGRAECEDFLAYIIESKSAATAKIRHTSLSLWFKWLADEEEIDRSPMLKVRPPAVPEQPVPIMSDDELRALLKATEGKDFAARRDTAIIRLFMDTGMRRGECASLAITDVDLDQQVAFVLGKGRRGRACPFGDKTSMAIDRYLRLRGRHPHAGLEALWLSDQNKTRPFGHDGIEQMIRRRAAQAGLEGVHAHRLRHTAAHQWLANGGQEQDLMRLLGWRSRAMLGRYGASAADERARDAFRRMKLGDRL